MNGRCSSRWSGSICPPAGRSQAAALLIGPEGGFGPRDHALLDQVRFVRPVSLGRRILRAETAAIVGSGLVAGAELWLCWLDRRAPGFGFTGLMGHQPAWLPVGPMTSSGMLRRVAGRPATINRNALRTTCPIPQTPTTTPITSVRQMADYFAAGCKPPDQFRIGTEHEKFGFRRRRPFAAALSAGGWASRQHPGGARGPGPLRRHADPGRRNTLVCSRMAPRSHSNRRGSLNFRARR